MLFHTTHTLAQWRKISTLGSSLIGHSYSRTQGNSLNEKIIKNIPILRGVRLRFKGKTLKAKRTALKSYWFKLGWSHQTISFLNFGVSSKIRGKQRLVFWSYSRLALHLSAVRFCLLKPTNLYHARGIRCSRTRRLFKEGKVSTYR